MTLAHSFYAEQAAVLRRPRRGPPPPPGRCSTSTASRPTIRSPSRRASYSRAKLAHPRRRPRRGRAALPGRDRGLRAARPAGHELDVPRHGRRLRRARRRLPRRDHDAGSRDRDQRGAARRLHRFAASPASAGCCSTTGRLARAEAAYQRALDSGPPRAPHHGRSSSPTPAWPPLHRLHGRDDAAGRGGHRGAGALPGRRVPAGSGTASTPRPTSRPPPRRAAWCSPSSPPSADEPERAATLLGQADRLRADAGVEVAGVPARRRRSGPERARSRRSAPTRSPRPRREAGHEQAVTP